MVKIKGWKKVGELRWKRTNKNIYGYKIPDIVSIEKIPRNKFFSDKKNVWMVNKLWRPAKYFNNKQEAFDNAMNYMRLRSTENIGDWRFKVHRSGVLEWIRYDDQGRKTGDSIIVNFIRNSHEKAENWSVRVYKDASMVENREFVSHPDDYVRKVMMKYG